VSTVASPIVSALVRTVPRPAGAAIVVGRWRSPC
jgi:hypothetical protein